MRCCRKYQWDTSENGMCKIVYITLEVARFVLLGPMLDPESKVSFGLATDLVCLLSCSVESGLWKC